MLYHLVFPHGGLRGQETGCRPFPQTPLQEGSSLPGNLLWTLHILLTVDPTSEGNKKSCESVHTGLVLNLPCEGLGERAIAESVEGLSSLKALEEQIWPTWPFSARTGCLIPSAVPLARFSFLPLDVRCDGLLTYPSLFSFPFLI